MLGYIAIYVVIGVVIVMVSLLLISMRGRGKPIVCPECGTRFGRPALAEKRIGVGFTFSGLGNYTCPKCGYKASTSSFRSVGKEEPGNDNSTNN